MNPKDPEYIDEQFLDKFLSSLNLLEVKERFKIRPEDFKTRLDLQCYLIALQITATDKDFFMPISGKPKMGKSTLGIWVGLKTVEALKKKFHVEIPEFSIENDIHYPPISEKEMFEIMDNDKPALKMFDRIIFEDKTLMGIGVNASEIKNLKEGTCVYFSNMKTRKKGYNKFENDAKDIFQNSFIYDLIFTNPLMPEKNYDEFCDILITFFESILVIQCKECSNKDLERQTKATIIDGLNQLKTSMNRARTRSIKLFMLNSNKIFKDYNFSDVKDIYPILIVNEKLPFLNYNGLKDIPEIKKLDFVPIILTLEDLRFLVSELSTPSDLFTYFKMREEFIKKDEMPFADERELLSYYLMNDKTFEPKYVGTRSGILIGFQEEYESGRLSELFAKKKELDKVSYWVDDLLKGTYLSYEPNYLKGIEEILKLNRIQRRNLAKRAEEKRNKSITEKKDAWGLTIYEEKPEIAFVVYFTQEFDGQTQPFFYSMCACAQYKTNVKKVVGLAQTLSNPRYNMGLYFEKGEGFTLEEETALKKLCDGFWGEGANSKYGEFSE